MVIIYHLFIMLAVVVETQTRPNPATQVWYVESLNGQCQHCAYSDCHVGALYESVSQCMSLCQCATPVVTTAVETTTATVNTTTTVVEITTAVVDETITPIPGGYGGYATTSGTACTDYNALCSYWAATSQCTSNPTYMTSQCSGSCNADCANYRIEASCTDTSASCGGWASMGECSKNPTYMHWSCPTSCKLQRCGFDGTVMVKTDAGSY